MPYKETGVLCDVKTYNRRMWCRAENLCHSMRNGTSHMWVATGTSDAAINRQADDEEFLNSNLHVFHGDATMEADKLTLVVPILGLYAELYAIMIEKSLAATTGESMLTRLSVSMARGDSVESPEPKVMKATTLEGSTTTYVPSPVLPATGHGLDEDCAAATTQRRWLATMEGAADIEALSPVTVEEGRLRVSIAEGEDSALKSQSALKKRARVARASARAAIRQMQTLRESTLATTEGHRVDLHEALLMNRLEQVIGIISNKKDAIFPRSLELKDPGDESKRVKHELFGPLVAMVEATIETDVELRSSLVEQAVRRKAAARSHVMHVVKTTAIKWRTKTAHAAGQALTPQTPNPPPIPALSSAAALASPPDSPVEAA